LTPEFKKQKDPGHPDRGHNIPLFYSGAQLQLFQSFPLVIGREAKATCPVIDFYMTAYPYDIVIHSSAPLSFFFVERSLPNIQFHKTDFKREPI
jgi:hypothetical protein